MLASWPRRRRRIDETKALTLEYFLLSLAAVFLLAGLNALLGRGGRLARARQAVSDRLREDLIDFEEREGVLLNDGAAYLALGDALDDFALAVARGDSWVLRRFRSAELRELHRDGARLRLRLNDFTLPRVDLTFPDAAAAAAWEARLSTPIPAQRNEARAHESA